MQLTVKGKQLDVGQALRTYVEDQLGAVTKKYFSDTVDGTVFLSQDAHLYKANISVHVGRGIMLESTAEASEIYPAFDLACGKIAKRLLRYKSRLRDHHANENIEELATQYVMNGTDHHSDANDEGEPAIIAEMPTHIGVMTVAEAVMYMDLADLPALMFRNSAHNGLNMVYRRGDGNIGWVDPRGNIKQ
jgi:ribosomal subunit interface protein